MRAADAGSTPTATSTTHRDPGRRRRGAVADAAAAGVATMVTVGCDRATSLAALAVAGRHADVCATVGLHPHDAVNGVDSIVDLLDRPTRRRRRRSAGSTTTTTTRRATCSATRSPPRSSSPTSADLPLVIHTRDAWDDTFDILAAEGVPERTIFHCFTGGPDEARRCLDLGAFVSFSGIVTFKTRHRRPGGGARSCPLERMLVETDSPYLAPVPHRGQPNRPAWVPFVGAFVAELRGIAVDDAGRRGRGRTSRAAFPAVAS